jgi:hypothetical protein
VLVHFEQLQRVVADLGGDLAVSTHFREVADAPQQPVAMRGVPRDRRRQFGGSLGRDRDVEDPRRSRDDGQQVALFVEVEPVRDPEPRPQRRRQQPRSRRRANEREGLQRHLHRSRARALADHDVGLEVLHRRVQMLFDHRAEPVDLIDEQHLALFEVGEDRDQVAGLFEHRPRGRAHRDAHFVGDDVGERGLAEARRAVEQHVVEGFVSLTGGRDRHDQVLADARLTDVVGQRPRPQPGVVLRVVVDRPRVDDAIVGHPAITFRTSRSSASNVAGAPLVLRTRSTDFSAALR